MSDYLLLAGVALCAISVVVAVLQLLQTRAPRAAVILLLLGIVALFAGARSSTDPFSAQTLTSAWARVTQGGTTAP